MNKYRLARPYDGYNEYICLKCKGEFVHVDGTSFAYKFCPHCATAWDGEFTKRNRTRAKPTGWRDDTYETLPNGNWLCHKPRLILQTQDSSYTYNVGSQPRYTPQWGLWKLYCHCELSPDIHIEGKSVSAHMLGCFKAACKQRYDAVRLILQEGTSFKVIKEWERPK